METHTCVSGLLPVHSSESSIVDDDEPPALEARLHSGLAKHDLSQVAPRRGPRAPGGGGKIPLLPEYVGGRAEGRLVLRNFEGRLFAYPDADSIPVELGVEAAP